MYRKGKGKKEKLTYPKSGGMQQRNRFDKMMNECLFITGKLQKNYGKTTWKTYNNRLCRNWICNIDPRWNNNGDSNNLEEITKINTEGDSSHLASTTPIHQGGMCRIPGSDYRGTWTCSTMVCSRTFHVMYYLRNIA